ncbi:MAG TPA: hypothetical protein VM537_27950, partial [Anaerolineae bacterium]|nr:hypothetical protein [Anaerolineae bacterium]
AGGPGLRRLFAPPAQIEARVMKKPQLVVGSTHRKIKMVSLAPPEVRGEHYVCTNGNNSNG